MKNMVLIGLGHSGLGEQLIKEFSHKSFDVTLMGRNRDRLVNCQQELQLENIPLTTTVIDLNNSHSINQAFSTLSRVDVLIYNAVARRTMPSTKLSRKEAEADFSITVGGAIDCVQAALPKLKQEKGSILFTGGGVSLTPSVPNSSMSLDKAALRNYAFSLAQDLQPDNVYVGTVTITQFIKNQTDYSPKKLSHTYWKLYQEQPGNFEFIV